MELKKLNTLIKTIGRNATTQREQIQEALIGCALYAFSAERNIDPFKNLFAAVGTGVHKAGMSKWASLHAPVHFANDEVKLSSDRQKEMFNTITAEQYEADLRAAPEWYVMGESSNKSPNVWDAAEAFNKLIEQMGKLGKKADKNGDSIAAIQLFSLAEKAKEFVKTVDVVEV